MEQPKKRDLYRNIKWLAYKKIKMSPGSTYLDFLQYAKFQLALITKTLLHDPVWSTYTNEELLIEFYAHLFETDEAARSKFENELGLAESEADDFSNWADKHIAEDNKLNSEQLNQTEDHISFNPTTLGEDT